MIRRCLYFLETLPVYFFFALFRLMPLNAASWLGGKLAKGLGPFLSVSRFAERSLKCTIPGLSDEECHRTILEMWEQLGRTIGEFPHLRRKTMLERIEVTSPGVAGPVLYVGFNSSVVVDFSAGTVTTAEVDFA